MKKQLPAPVEVNEPLDQTLDETIDYLIIVENFYSAQAMGGVDQRYGVMNKNTGVIEMRFGEYPAALQALVMVQEAYDKYFTMYKRAMGMLN